MRLNSTPYVLGFATAICLVCSIFVSGAAVSLKDRQEANKVLDRQKKVLTVAGLIEEGNEPPPAEIEKLFQTRIKPRLVNLKTGDYDQEGDAAAFDQRKARQDPATSEAAPANDAKVLRIPNQGIVYHLVDEGKDEVKLLILPVEGKGLWSTLYGYVALAPDVNTINGLTFYEHAETPGLGGEVDNTRWKALWPGRKLHDADGKIAIEVIKGQAGKPDKDPHKVDGLSGATITSRGVTYLLQFWMGEHGWGPYLNKFKAGKEA